MIIGAGGPAKTSNSLTVPRMNPIFKQGSYLSILTRVIPDLNTLPNNLKTLTRSKTYLNALTPILNLCQIVAYLNTNVEDPTRDPVSIPYLETWRVFNRPLHLIDAHSYYSSLLVASAVLQSSDLRKCPARSHVISDHHRCFSVD